MKDVARPVKPSKNDGEFKEGVWRLEWKEYNARYNAVQMDHKVRLLLKWFKEEFFKWVNSPECPICKVLALILSLHKGETRPIGIVPPTDEEARYTARNVELSRCQKCNREVRFPRYNDPIKLLATRCGRCGEFANVPLPFTSYNCSVLHFLFVH
jgi:hypothetical protein